MMWLAVAVAVAVYVAMALTAMVMVRAETRHDEELTKTTTAGDERERTGIHVAAQD